MQNYLVNELSEISLSMFRKNFFGIYHGSISARTEQDRFIINKKNAIFDRIGENSLVELYSKKDYRWNDASIDAYIHLGIYSNISEAKYACYAMPPYTIAYSLNHNNIIPKDYFGLMLIGKTNIYDPKQFDDWYERADVEIYRYFMEKNTNIMVIKGYGVFAYDRDIHSMAKNVALIENTCRVLLLSKDEKQL
ncbi:MAG: class II aldolase and adducin N-terminal domain-containing protein [Campylobacteraceae bacterium]|jgi:L-fuculose-phosphate aldolase|nr:class II aldolase and adducin N-terminal domain-containing protein [Campylobacteraceae bacterium]